MRIRLYPGFAQRVENLPGVTEAVDRLATSIAKAVDDQGLVAESGWARTGVGPDIVAEVRLHDRGGRRTATVEIFHPAAIAMQARHGVMTKAAAAVGVEVHGGGNG